MHCCCFLLLFLCKSMKYHIEVDDEDSICTKLVIIRSFQFHSSLHVCYPRFINSTNNFKNIILSLHMFVLPDSIFFLVFKNQKQNKLKKLVVRTETRLFYLIFNEIFLKILINKIEVGNTFLEFDTKVLICRFNKAV